MTNTDTSAATIARSTPLTYRRSGESLSIFALRSPNGQAELVFERGPLQRALDQTLRMVPAGAEHIDWDRITARLVGGAR
jgi:hypothetical protein